MTIVTILPIFFLVFFRTYVPNSRNGTRCEFAKLRMNGIDGEGEGESGRNGWSGDEMKWNDSNIIMECI